MAEKSLSSSTENLQRIWTCNVCISLQNEVLFSKIDQYVERHRLFENIESLVLGCSGGPDSVFLAYYMHRWIHKSGLSVTLAYFDHEWRVESAQEAQFCAALAQSLQFKFITTKASELNSGIKYNGSREEVGRRLRRLFFAQTCSKTGANSVLLAHHVDDQRETFFIRLARGATLTGLSGMRPKKGPFLRPLLEISKEEIVAFLEQNKIAYCVDQTNMQPDFLRNRLRHSLMPVLRRCDDRFEKNIDRSIAHIQAIEDWLEQYTQKMLRNLSVVEGSKTGIDIQQLKNVEEPIRTRLICAWLLQERISCTLSEAFLAEVSRFLFHSRAQAHQPHEGWRIRKMHLNAQDGKKRAVIIIEKFG